MIQYIVLKFSCFVGQSNTRIVVTGNTQSKVAAGTGANKYHVLLTWFEIICRTAKWLDFLYRGFPISFQCQIDLS